MGNRLGLEHSEYEPSYCIAPVEQDPKSLKRPFQAPPKWLGSGAQSSYLGSFLGASLGAPFGSFTISPTGPQATGSEVKWDNPFSVPIALCRTSPSLTNIHHPQYPFDLGIGVEMCGCDGNEMMRDEGASSERIRRVMRGRTLKIIRVFDQ